MEYVYAAMLLHKAGHKVDEAHVKKVLEAAGAKVARGRWSARLAGPELAAKDKEMLAQGANIMYTTFEKGTTFPLGLENSTGTEHMGTWKFAYLNEGIRDWLFSQSK